MMPRATLIRLAISLVLPLVVLLLPREVIPIEGLTVTQHRVLVVFALALCLWVLEPIPIFATSVLVIVLELVFISDRGLVWLRSGDDPATFGALLSYKEVMGTMADPIIMLFLGGLFLATAATKFQLDNNLGRVLLRPFGTRSSRVMLGMMVVTAIFSMFMSNTACTAMMLAVLMPVLRSIEPDDPARVGFALAIPFAANVGGIGTPIGTPPNAVGLKYLVNDAGQPLVSFPGWMVFAVPFVVVLLLATWLMLLMFFKPKRQQLVVNFQGQWRRDWRAWVVYVTSAGTILLWLTAEVHGMSSHVVAMLPVATFCVTGIMTTRDLQGLSWDVLWLVAGGFALGLGLEETGLSAALVASVPFQALPVMLVVLIAVGLTFAMANFMSHTATANLMLPIMATLGASLSSLAPLGGRVMLILVVTFTSSLAMSMPITTPPNAMAYATGWVNTRDMAKAGLCVGALGLALLAAMTVVLNMVGFFDA